MWYDGSVIPTKKSLGQHWLSDDASLDAMCAAAQIGPDDTVLEIGPGPGTLTAKLVGRARQIIAVEFDSQLANLLPDHVGHIVGYKPPVSRDGSWTWDKNGAAGSLQVVQQDILQFDLTSLPAGYKIVANIPYYLTSNLLRVLCESPNPFSQAALLVQKEVAQRVCAQPGDMSILSVSVQFYCQVALGTLVPARLFTPPPKVDSQILQLTYRPEPLFPGINTKRFFRIVKAGFAQRRKTLLNALSAGLHLDRDKTTAALQTAGIAPTTRAQNLSLQDWHALYQALS